MVVLNHLGNWELFAQIMPHYFGYTRLSTVYQKLGNRYLDQLGGSGRGGGTVRPERRLRGGDQIARGGGMIDSRDQHAATTGSGRRSSAAGLRLRRCLVCLQTNRCLLAASLFTEGQEVADDLQPAGGRPGDTVESLTAKANNLIAGEFGRARGLVLGAQSLETPRPNWLLSEYKRRLYLPPEISPNELKPFRILIRASNWLGDCVISIPAVRAIKRGRPDAQITILAPEKIAALWRLLPEADAVLSLGKKSIWGAARLLRDNGQFDVDRFPQLSGLR